MKVIKNRLLKTLKLLKESFLFAWHAVGVNRLRTLLSLLGITIGIFAIISVFTMIDSLEWNIRNSISSLGDDVIYIQKWPWSFESNYRWWDYLKRPVPKYSEYEELKRRTNTAQAVGIYVAGQFMVKYRNNSANDIIVWANSHEFNQIRPIEFEKGRYFTEAESRAGRNVAIIGNELASKLFQGQDPLGKEFKIGAFKFRVIGVPIREGNNIFGGGSLDNVVIIPLNAARNLIDLRNDRSEPTIMVKAKPGVALQEMMDEMEGLMRSIRRLKPTQESNFALNQASILNRGLDQIFGVIKIAGWFIGIFSIIVGGFGIANIMFVSVKERTNIIGIQKALGAKNYFILTQFLFEAVLLAVAGGILGLLVVFLGALWIRTSTTFYVFLSFDNILMGVMISATIGILSGIFPARKAALLNPVEAIATTF
ncbi:MAG: ABC transporter permease [Bacteroidales bacterium]|nr:ABC transporter permease [Bacteroidales bacterium]